MQVYRIRFYFIIPPETTRILVREGQLNRYGVSETNKT